MFCEQCGAPIPEGARFCEECGAPVPQEAVPVAPVAQPIPRSGTVTPRRFSPPRLVIGALILAILGYAAYWVLYMM